jgi:acetyl-CoA carboxylase carboxyl transferase subunit alpha
MEKTAFERVTLARHPERPYTLDLFASVFTDFVEIHGDRRFADDPAMVCGFAKLSGLEAGVIGQQKGRDTNSRKYRNFGMPKPEGYRKALRLMHLAEKFNRPVICFIDTPGAYPGIDAEERGQAEAIAFNLREMANLKTPLIVVVIGEGGSGGALAIGVGDRILMMENAVYSVISPEGCAAILWKDAAQAPRAAESLRLTADNLKQLGIIDEIIPEPSEWKQDPLPPPMSPSPPSSASKSNSETGTVVNPSTENLKNSLLRHLSELQKLPAAERLARRYEKFRKMGDFLQSPG